MVVNGLGPVPGLNPRGWRINPPPKPSVTCSGPFILSGLRPTVAQFCPPACQLLQTLAAGLPLNKNLSLFSLVLIVLRTRIRVTDRGGLRSRGFSTSLSTSSSEPESVSQIGQRLRSSESFPFGSLSKNEYTLIAPLPATRTRTAPEMNLLRKTAEYRAGLLAYTLLAPALSVLVKDQKPPTAWLKSKTSRLSV